MIYKYTLLKELPDYPIGHIFYIDDEGCNSTWYYDPKIITKSWSGKIVESYSGTPASIYNVLKREDWVKKEVAIEKTKDLSCPKCSSSKVFIHTYTTYREYVHEKDGYYTASKIEAECICGNKYILNKRYIK